MSESWIKIDHTTVTKAEVVEIAETIKVTPDHALGMLVRFWVWVDQNAKPGVPDEFVTECNKGLLRDTEVGRCVHVSGVTYKAVDKMFGRAGFMCAQEAVGWVARGDMKSGLVIINFGQTQGPTAKSRSSSARRKAKWRAKVHSIGTVPRNVPHTVPRNVPNAVPGTFQERSMVGQVTQIELETQNPFPPKTPPSTAPLSGLSTPVLDTSDGQGQPRVPMSSGLPGVIPPGSTIDPAWLSAAAKALGITAHVGESQSAFDDRVRSEVFKRRKLQAR